MDSNDKILIIGGTGFIGEYVIRELGKSADQYQLQTIHLGRTNGFTKFPNVDYFEADLAKNDPSTRKILENANIIMILTQPNQNIMANILSAAENSFSLKKIVYASSLLVYAESFKKQPEDSGLDPLSQYEKDKTSEEKLLRDFSQKTGKQVIIARLANVYGDKKNTGIIGKLFLNLLTGQELVINGDGTQKRDYIFVEDVASLLKFLIEKEFPKKLEIFNLCSGEGHTINELIDLVGKTANKRIAVSYGPAVLEKRTIIGDGQKIFHLMGKKLKYNLKSGLKKTYTNCYSK